MKPATQNAFTVPLFSRAIGWSLVKACGLKVEKQIIRKFNTFNKNDIIGLVEI
jgi:hypothetical protein